jgi:ABC-type cobalamin/Fe3+-siderophores transport system ATPase subunit
LSFSTPSIIIIETVAAKSRHERNIQQRYIRRVDPMVQLIVGNKGKGKTSHLLDKVNTEIRNTTGNIVYLDKNAKHMYDLNNRVRLIDVSQYMITDQNGFLGFICGILSQDHDLQQMYLDSFMRLAKLDEKDLASAVAQIEKIGERFGVDFYISISVDKDQLPDSLQDKVFVAL